MQKAGWCERVGERAGQQEGTGKLTSSDGGTIYQSDDAGLGNEDGKTGSEWIRRLHSPSRIDDFCCFNPASGGWKRDIKLNKDDASRRASSYSSPLSALSGNKKNDSDKEIFTSTMKFFTTLKCVSNKGKKKSLPVGSGGADLSR